MNLVAWGSQDANKGDVSILGSMVFIKVGSNGNWGTPDQNSDWVQLTNDMVEENLYVNPQFENHANRIMSHDIELVELKAIVTVQQQQIAELKAKLEQFSVPTVAAEEKTSRNVEV